MPLFRTILFAADFSEVSQQAFRVACALASENKTRLIVLHIVEETTIAEQQVAFGEWGAPVLVGDRGRAHQEALKLRLREFYVPGHPFDVDYHVQYGLATEEILDMAGELGADLIVLGTHGRTGLRRLLAGSVAEGVLRGARCAVLALRSSEVSGPAEDLRIILHPTDFSECSESALEVARFLAREHGAQLVVLHVSPIEVLINETTSMAVNPEVYEHALKQMCGELDGPDLKYPVATQLRVGDAAREILATAQEIGCDLIVMGTCSRSGLGRILMGSVAEAVLRGSRCPVLAVKKPVAAAIIGASPQEGAPV